MSLAYMKIGTAIAFLEDNQIAFGAVVEKITREKNKKDRTVEIVLEALTADGDPRHVTIHNEDDIADLSAWNKDDQLLALAMRSEHYKHALAIGERLILNEDREDKIAAPEAVVESSPESSQQSAVDPAEPRNDADVPL